MRQKIWDFVKKYNMIQKRDRILVACSGGADSVALLRLLWERHTEMGYEVEAVHVEHGIRGTESREDERFVRELCLWDNIPYYCEHVDAPGYAALHHLGLEEAARILRYEVLERRARQIYEIEATLDSVGVSCASASNRSVKIALAHHQEDNAETILFQMARGSGLSGMCGIAPVRKAGELVYIRPLLGCSRSEIEAYLAERHQVFCMDQTNEDQSYRRNFIRRQLLPLMVELNDQAVLHMNQMAEQMREVREYMELSVKKEWDRLVSVETEGVYSCGIAELQALPEALEKAVLYEMITAVCGQRKDIGLVHVEMLRQLMNRQTGSTCKLPLGCEAMVQYGKILVRQNLQDAEREPDRIRCEVTGEQLAILRESTTPLEIDTGMGVLTLEIASYHGGAGEIHKKAYTKTFDYDKMKKGFCIRNRERDDYLCIDREGHHKQLHKYLVDEKIPSQERDRMLLIANGNEIIWCVGGRVGENYKVTEQTHYLLHITYNGGNRDGYIKA